MAYPAQRSNFRPSRGAVVLLLIVGAVIAAAFWIGPFRPIPAELRLLVADSAGRGHGVLPNAGTRDEPRFPLVLAVQNRGGRVARPVSVFLSVPANFQVSSTGGPVKRDAVQGDPLVRYQLPVAERKVVPGAPAQPLAPGDTLWLEPQLPDYYCTAESDSIPEFVPAPALPASELANVQVYYSFADATYSGRDAGLLAVRLDPGALARQPAPMPPSFPTQVREPELPRPELGLLRSVGARAAQCGDPQQPLDLYTATWETDAGGRFLVVYLNGAPRKQLFDLNRDSIIELEMWDSDADGRFEARREARYAIPPFLLPERPPVAARTDSLSAQPGWEELFADIARGPFRFVPDSLVPAALRPRRVGVDSTWIRTFNDVAAGPFRFVPDSVVPPAVGRPAVVPSTVVPPAVAPPRVAVPGVAADTAWVRKFNNVAAGPFRFSDNPPPLRAKPKPRPRPRGPVPLGTPVPGYPRPGGE